MAPKRKRTPVHTEAVDPSDMVFVGEKYALPRQITASVDHGTETIDVLVEWVDGRAVPRRVTVSTERRRGISWQTLSSVPVRDVVATAVLSELKAVAVDDKGAVMFWMLGGNEITDEVIRLVQKSVGYDPDLGRFEVERSS